MGCWNETGAISGLPILCGDKVGVFIGRVVPGNVVDVVPITPIFWGEYNDYGGLENVEPWMHVELVERKLGKPLNDILRDFSGIDDCPYYRDAIKFRHRFDGHLDDIGRIRRYEVFFEHELILRDLLNVRAEDFWGHCELDFEAEWTRQRDYFREHPKLVDNMWDILNVGMLEQDKVVRDLSINGADPYMMFPVGKFVRGAYCHTVNHGDDFMEMFTMDREMFDSLFDDGMRDAYCQIVKLKYVMTLHNVTVRLSNSRGGQYDLYDVSRTLAEDVLSICERHKEV